MGPIGYSGARGKLIREKTWRRKSHLRLACGDFIYKLSMVFSATSWQLLGCIYSIWTLMEGLDFVSLANWNKYPGPGVHQYYTKIQVPVQEVIKVAQFVRPGPSSWASEKILKKNWGKVHVLGIHQSSVLRPGPQTWNILEQHIWGRSLSLNRNSYEQHRGWALDLDYIKSSIFEGAQAKWSQWTHLEQHIEPSALNFVLKFIQRSILKPDSLD